MQNASATPSATATATATGQDSGQLPRPGRLSDVKGWFHPVDQVLFDWILSRQLERSQRGDLLELGAYLGKSAIFMGAYLRAEETFTVCDLFDSPAPDEANSAEMGRSYATLTRRAFEANYRSFHDGLPQIVQEPSSGITAHVAADSCRFVHIDASHLYEHVHADIAAAREVLGQDGIVVLDDFRAEHCPGVAAATWGAVASGLKPLCITATKFYGTWGDYDAIHADLAAFLKGRDDMWHGAEEVAGFPMIRISGKKAKSPEQPVSRYADEAAPEPTAPATPPAGAGSRARGLLSSLLARSGRQAP
ncbi:class I SAM-dependent methyltransferase [Streptomyces durmitorensis]|uniref:Class I SAM-dependent methyltransferase n=1 Tax=Streptomyces durmitorensis TaxID=319947 RepID=A0ABY4PXQ0_9ACTN|nr:class I SAM-dependent methyltransferase [Streptomyces durmitorensis]UQT58222.1 class I SAM-dependent methyltransferase [Streptomyces durmitorensis]